MPTTNVQLQDSVFKLGFGPLSSINTEVLHSLGNVTDHVVRANFQQLYDAVNRLQRRLDKEDLDQIVNSTGLSLTPGSILGYDSTGTLALAGADSSAIIRAVMVCPETVANGELFTPSYIGRTRLRVEPSISPSAGDPVYLSGSTVGTATNTAPTSPDRSQLLGVWSDDVFDTEDGTVEAIVVLDVANFR